jgi:hypothetical protein
MLAPEKLPLELRGITLTCGTDLYTATIRIIDAILQGLDKKHACLHAGVYYKEILQKENEYPAVYKAIGRAIATNLLWVQESCKRASVKDWRAARAYASLCGDLERDASGKDYLEPPVASQGAGELANVDPAKLTDAELVRIARGEG